MGITVVSRRRSLARIEAEHPGALILDVTSRGPQPWVRFSPFYPHGGIPVFGTPGVTSQSVEGVWQALKVFERADVDPAKLAVTTMTNLKRTVRTNGAVRGHREGLHGERLLGYREARRLIYLPAYRWVLENHLADLVAELRGAGDVVLLDYTVNGDPDDLSSPLSHAALLGRHVAGDHP